MVLLNGAEGMGDMFAKALTMGGTGLGLARQLLATMNGSPAQPADGAAAASDERGKSAAQVIPVQVETD
jgi:hypothetical protein